MAAPGITILKQNVPWGPFTRAQVDAGLARGDFTVKYLAHAPGLTEWLPLGEVLDYVARHESSAAPVLPPIPEAREFPPVAPVIVAAPVYRPFHQPEPGPVPIVRPPVLPAAPPKSVEPAPPKPDAPPVIPTVEEKSEGLPELRTAPFFLRGIAFLIDCGVIFSPVVLLFLLGILSIELPLIFHHTNAQTISEEKALLWINAKRLSTLLAIGCGWLYAAWYESSTAQATIGKRWMGLRVVDVRGERISFLRASGRYAAKYLSALPCFLGFIMALFSSRGRALHDRLAGTRVVRD